MSVDLSKLSAKELYELAQKKEREEQEEAERQEKINELMEQRTTMLSEHKNVLLLTDKKIRDLQEQRDKLIADHDKALAELDAKIKESGGKAPANSQGTGGTTDSDKLKATIRQVMNKRPYISATLLKEKLAAYDIKPANFSQELEKWIKDGWFVSKGKGNYSLGKKI